MELADHIQKEHGGNKAAFARSISVTPQQLTNMLKAKKPYKVIDGEVVQVCYTLG